VGQQFEVRPGESSTIALTLQRESSTVTLQTIPANVMVYLDGTLRGPTLLDSERSLAGGRQRRCTFAAVPDRGAAEGTSPARVPPRLLPRRATTGRCAATGQHQARADPALGGGRHDYGPLRCRRCDRVRRQQPEGRADAGAQRMPGSACRRSADADRPARAPFRSEGGTEGGIRRSRPAGLRHRLRQ
jgi:hypothetical protein